MPYSIVYFDDARLDVREAKTWYKEKRDGLEKHFAEAIKTAILKLQQNPLGYAIKYKNIRIAHPTTFPYGIHFYINDATQQIVVVAVIHNKRHPDTATKRTI